jgi:molybdopterin synthase catalytic subunit
MNIEVELSASAIDVQKSLSWVQNPQSGGTNVFIGTVRNNTRGKAVLRLEFEAYEPMALKEMRKIAEGACNKWTLLAVSVQHRVGVLSIGDIAVVIAVAAAHRDNAFEACRYIIDQLKETVPIWKKEVFEDGETWVAAHP